MALMEWATRVWQSAGLGDIDAQAVVFAARASHTRASLAHSTKLAAAILAVPPRRSAANQAAAWFAAVANGATYAAWRGCIHDAHASG